MCCIVNCIIILTNKPVCLELVAICYSLCVSVSCDRFSCNMVCFIQGRTREFVRDFYKNWGYTYTPFGFYYSEQIQNLDVSKYYKSHHVVSEYEDR